MNIRITCIAAACAAAAFFACGALAAEETKAPTQQSRFSTCAHESKGLRGDDHQNFMSDCLKGREAEAAEIKKDAVSHRAAGEPGLQQTKMKVCNEEAGQKNLHGDERHAFMSACLKGQ